MNNFNMNFTSLRKQYYLDHSIQGWMIALMLASQLTFLVVAIMLFYFRVISLIEQNHRRVKRITRLMLEFKDFYAAQKTLTGIELMAMIKKGQMKKYISDNLSPAEQFYALAG